MSLQAMLWALDGAGPIPAPQKLVLIALADFVNDENGSCWPSQEVIAQRATMSARTVRRHISWLEDEGLLEVKRRWRGARQTSNLYRLNIGVRWDGPASKPTPEDKPPGQPMADNMTAMETPTTVGYPQSAGQVMEDNLSAMERPAETPERTGVQAAGGGLEIPMADTGDRHMADTGDRHMADTGVLRSPNRSLIEIPHPSLHPSEAGERAGGEAAASPREGAPDGARDGDWTPEQNPQTGTGQRSASGVAASPRAGAPDGVVALKVVPEPTAAPAPDRRERPQGDSGAMNHIDEISGPGVPGRPRETPSGPNPRHSGAAVTPADRELLEKVLPEPMRAIPPRDVPRVAGAVRERLAAGWSAEQIRRGLAARDLPDRVRHLTALVMARFRDDLPVDALPLDGGGGGDAGPGCRQPWRVLLDDGRTVGVRDLDMGAVAMAYAQARADGDPRAAGDRFAFAEAVGVEQFLLEPARRSRSASAGGRG